MQNKQLDPKWVSFHEKTMWTRFVLMGLAVWLLMFPASFSYESQILLMNDLICGVLLLALSLLAMSPNKVWPAWTISAIGVWLQFVPVLFWVKDPVVYINETFVGILSICMAVIIYQDPRDYLNDGPTIPKGWTYNPSSWAQRFPVIGLGLMCWLIARYMGSFQLGYISEVWDPIFGQGTHHVLTSDVSKAFPVSDASLGAVCYTIEFLMGCQGSERRWYTMPWSVVFFGILVVPVSVVSIVLIILQPLIVGHWCLWCLATAVCMLIMLALTLDEVAAVLQFLKETRLQKKPLWRTFWLGGDQAAGEREKDPARWSGSFLRLAKESVLGMTWEWNLIGAAFLGALLMFIPEFFSYSPYLANSNYIAGALIAVTAISALAEVARSVRYINIFLGSALVLMSWIFIGESLNASLINTLVGLAIIFLSKRKGKITQSYGMWDRWVF